MEEDHSGQVGMAGLPLVDGSKGETSEIAVILIACSLKEQWAQGRSSTRGQGFFPWLAPQPLSTLPRIMMRDAMRKSPVDVMSRPDHVCAAPT